MNLDLRKVSLAVYLGCLPIAGLAGTLYVASPPQGNDANPGTEGRPFASMQRGIDTALAGDTVVVAQGTYLETVRFKGKDIVLRSTDPLDLIVVSQTVMDGNGARLAVVFDGTETDSCVLEGFTVTRGSLIGSDALGAGISGGAANRRTHATIRNNRIIANLEVGVAFCDGLIEGNTISDNTSWQSAGGMAYCDGIIRGNRIASNRTFKEFAAGGLAWCGGLIEGNTIVDNDGSSMGPSGGGLAYCHGPIRSNIVRGNRAGGDAGGGVDHCDGPIQGNQITLNTAQYGGGIAHCLGLLQGNTFATNYPNGIYRSDAAVRNNLILHNQGHGLEQCHGAIENNTVFGNAGTALFECHGPILNCILWGNASGQDQLVASSVPAYSCVQHRPGGGVGNFALAPHFLDVAAGDFHLQPWSPAIDAGDPTSDASQEPVPGPKRIDLGAYGNTLEATTPSLDTDGDGLPDAWEIAWFGNLGEDALGDPDGDRIVNLTEYSYGWDPRTAAATRVQNRTQGKWYESIQVALGESVKDDQLVVEPGLFRENVHFHGRDVRLRSTDPMDPEVVARTIIEGYPSGPVVAFAGTEDDEYCLLEGLTLRHGEDAECSQTAWGVLGGTAERHTRAHIYNCVITSNRTEQGGGMIYCDGILRGNVITNNTAWSGGGLAYCNGVIEVNTIAHNRATLGGGLANCFALIHRNVIADNLGHGGGGGLYQCSGTVKENTIRGNWTEQDESSGGGLKGCSAWIGFNLIVGNRSRCDGGGGLAGCGGNIVGNLIVANTTDGIGGGLFDCDGLLQNNTVAGNRAGSPSCGGMYGCSGLIENCIVWGNTPEGGRQLAECSVPAYSCIQSWTEGGEGNVTADPHFVDGSRGDYRLRSDSPCIDAGEPGGVWLPERDLAGTHRVLYGGRRFVVDMGAYEFGIARCEVVADRRYATLTWSSRNGEYYSISWSTDLETWYSAASIRSTSDLTTTWTDDGSMTGGQPVTAPWRFYRISR